MKCKKCNGMMFIDEWNGWVWACVHCDHIGRRATDREVEKHEKGFVNDLRASTINDKAKSRSQV